MNSILSLYRLYASVMGRRAFHKLNRGLFMLGMRGMGLLNYENERLSGTAHLFRRTIRPALRGHRAIILDVGANVGNFTLDLLTTLPDAQVHAFEPHPQTFAVLRGRVPQSVHCVQAAMSDRAGFMSLYDRATSDGSEHASLFPDVITTLHKEEVTEHKVEVLTVDEYCQAHQITHIDLLKVDTEGNEARVFAGADRTLRQGLVKIILFEFNQMNVVSRVFFSDIIKALPEYRLYRLLPHGLLPLTPYNPIYHELFVFQNILAVHRTAALPGD